MSDMKQIKWDPEYWRKTCHEIRKMEGDWNMDNEEIQAKILETIKEKNSSRGL
jgi:hypothetical protein